MVKDRIMMLRHFWAEIDLAAWYFRCALKSLAAAVFGRVTHDGLAITFMGTIYRIKPVRHTR